MKQFQEMVKQGDIIWITTSNNMGHEQQGTRPGIVLSTQKHNYYTGMVTVAPITSNTKSIPTDIILPNNLKTNGRILMNQVRSFDLNAREYDIVESVPQSTIDDMLKKNHLIYYNN
ncbi:type II toxin-antitoxin system PemK/MazF family toxin [Apilactobacillus micheneri]|uniref:type II toxin-antitoxin system PemK/MazF family toxin n=1 Tax=Apilactobacillus micheneri TaxID=1899430 RepID=UPI000D041602|nr:type II toxin-antitoxin system PemK/MazF family toxin [Apilactobacillus micheneri]